MHDRAFQSLERRLVKASGDKAVPNAPASRQVQSIPDKYRPLSRRRLLSLAALPSLSVSIDNAQQGLSMPACLTLFIHP